VLFVTTHKMLQHIHGGRADGTWDKRLAPYVRPDRLVLDDFGLKPLAEPAPADLYDVLTQRTGTCWKACLLNGRLLDTTADRQFIPQKTRKPCP
jgi:hypothetical protein